MFSNRLIVYAVCVALVLLELKASADDTARLKEMLSSIGGEIANMDLSQILMITKAGSFLYDVQTPQSDVDYVIIYADPVEVNSFCCSYACRVV